MDLDRRLSVSYYQTIAVLNDSHQVYLVRHPMEGIPRIIDYCEADSRLIVIEEYISGLSLDEKIQKADFTENDLFSYMADLCSILEKLHSLNPPLIHRDIKPSNIIITNYNRVILLDFNAAKRFSPGESEDTILLGTRGYAAPEQYGFGSSSPQTDIYASGIILKEMADALKINRKSLHQMIDRCTRMNPSERYRNVSELKSALSTVSRQSHESPCSETGKAKPQSFLPPGFRSKTPWKMFLATTGYLFILWISMVIEVDNAGKAELWFDRISFLMIFLSVILVGFNYLNIQHLFPLCQSKNKQLRHLGMILSAFMAAFILLFIWAHPSVGLFSGIARQNETAPV